MARRGGRNVRGWRHAQALMYMAVILQLLASAAACALAAGPGPGAFRLPEGGEDGIYHAFVDENGEMQVIYLGKPNATSTPGPNIKPRDIGGPGRKLLQGAEGVHCYGSVNSDDAITATTYLAQYFGDDGNSFHGTVYAHWQSAIAYGCDYGYRQDTTSSQIWSDANAISSVSGGWGLAGWYSHASWKASYGRCSDSEDFC